MKRVIFGACISLVAFGCQSKTDETTTVETGSNTAPPFAALTYAPISDLMSTTCVGCHGAKNPKEGLDLTSYESLMKGGEHGPVVVAGDPAASRLVMFLRGTKTPRMPMKQDPLPEATIQAVEAWIKYGAKK